MLRGQVELVEAGCSDENIGRFCSAGPPPLKPAPWCGLLPCCWQFSLHFSLEAMTTARVDAVEAMTAARCGHCLESRSVRRLVAVVPAGSQLTTVPQPVCVLPCDVLSCVSAFVCSRLILFSRRFSILPCPMLSGTFGLPVSALAFTFSCSPSPLSISLTKSQSSPILPRWLPTGSRSRPRLRNKSASRRSTPRTKRPSRQMRTAGLRRGADEVEDWRIRAREKS